AEQLLAVAHEVHAALEAIPVHNDAHQIALEDATDGPTCERLGSHVANAGARGDTGKARVGDHRDLLTPGQVLESGGDLVDLLHARSQRAAADEGEDVARPPTARAPALCGPAGGTAARADRGGGPPSGDA